MSEMANYIHMKDKEQGDPATARVCPIDPAHGRMGVHATGGALVCCHVDGRNAKNGPVYCEGHEVLSR